MNRSKTQENFNLILASERLQFAINNEIGRLGNLLFHSPEPKEIKAYQDQIKQLNLDLVDPKLYQNCELINSRILMMKKK